MDLENLLKDAESLPDQIRASADACGDNLELRLRLSLNWVAARKLVDAVRALAQPSRPCGPPELRLVK
jgi:hypothetical protein